MKPEQAFNAALASFKAADAEVAKLTIKLDQANARRVEAALASASADSGINEFATGTEFDPDKASSVVFFKQKSDAVIDLLDRGIDHLATELATAKIDLIAAEQECATAQAAFHDGALDEQTHRWLRSNAKQLQALCQQLHQATIFAMTKDGGPRSEYPPAHVEYIFLNILPRLVSNEFADDEEFRNGCQASLSGAPINRLVVSQNLTDRERQAIAGAGFNRERRLIALRKMSEPVQQTEQTFNRYTAEVNLATLRDRAQKISHRIAELEKHIAVFEKKSPTSMNLTAALAIGHKKTELVNARNELERIESMRRGLEQKLHGQAA